MQRQITLQTGRLARATLASAGSWGPRGTASAFEIAVADTFAVSSSCCAVGGLTNAAAAAAAAWPRSLRAWSSQLQLQGDALLVAAQQSSTQRQLEQRRGMASAQAEPSTGGSEAVGAAPGSLSISDAAVQRLKELQAQSGAPVALRVTVEGGGCSGFQYEFAIEEGATATAQPAETDRLFERGGVRVVCDDISLEFLKGATVDFESDLMRSAFVISANPNAASSCGCGSSFVAK